MSTTENAVKKKTVTIYPGDPLPQGIYLNGWKLDHNSSAKPRGLYLIIQEPQEQR